MKPYIKPIIGYLFGFAVTGAVAQAGPESDRESIIYFSPPGLTARSTPEQDLSAVRRYYQQRFPKIDLQDYVYGALNFSADARSQYESLMDAPPFFDDIEEGKKLWQKRFANGKSLEGCFPNGGRNVIGNYPYFDPARKKVVTFEMAINDCLRANGEKTFAYADINTMGRVTAYARTLSDGMKTAVKVEGPDALAAYQAGKQFYYARRGQLNFACAHCHFDTSGQLLRSEYLSPMLGQTTHWPVFRQGTDLWSLHRRFAFCNQQVRAVPLEQGSEEYNNLEYYMTYLSNELPLKSSVFRK